jgi:Histidine kinase-like ATPase domain
MIKCGTLATVWQKSETGLHPCPASVCVNGEHLFQALAWPTVVCIEQGQDPALPDFDQGLMLRLSSTTIFTEGNVGESFVDAVIARGWLYKRHRDSAILALHEGLANAVIHGNFAISGGNATDVDSFREHGLLIERRLSDPFYNQRAVTVMAQSTAGGVEISIQDHGGGFIRPAEDRRVTLDNLSPLTKRGRGLGLMQNVCSDMRYEDGGRRLVLIFARLPE